MESNKLDTGFSPDVDLSPNRKLETSWLDSSGDSGHFLCSSLREPSEIGQCPSSAPVLSLIRGTLAPLSQLTYSFFFSKKLGIIYITGPIRTRNSYQ